MCSRNFTPMVAVMMSLFMLFTNVTHAQQSENMYTLVVVGSSTAEGYKISPIDSAWVYRLAHAYKGKVVVRNLAKAGYTTYQVNPTGTSSQNRPQPDNQRNITKALSFMPDAIIVNLPSNDAAAGYSIEEQKANFNLIMQEAIIRNVPIWVTTTQPRTDNFGQPREPLFAMKEWLLATYKEKAINFWEPFADTDYTTLKQYEQSDRIHLTIPAHRIMFEKVYALSILDTMRKGPVKFVSASTEQLPEKQSLHWHTAGERYIDSFLVERSADSISWTAAGRVKATGTTILTKNYTFTDDVKQSSAFYRIRAKDSLGRVFILHAQKFTRAVSAYNLKSFSAQLQDNKVLLQWGTWTEKLTVRFILESSTDKISWTPASEIPAGGNTTSESQYSYTDNGPLPLVIYYRLKMEDIDGGFTFSNEVRVITLITAVPDAPGDALKVYAYPNPASTSIWLKGLPNGAHHLQIFDVTGRLMHEDKQYRQSEIHVQSWPRGTYFMVADKGKYRITFQRM